MFFNIFFSFFKKIAKIKKDFDTLPVINIYTREVKNAKDKEILQTFQ